ncbi:hypothetical protein WR25_08102 [Diploscapter pachys]|uniref:Uncharacterized protein n=1 Tax=Diploscapter pachys TaxID=2018661 RepID=A0A2A2M402_9BILA|nr:hypothetical protein WR25_08102 [Diploscapter pachys]
MVAGRQHAKAIGHIVQPRGPVGIGNEHVLCPYQSPAVTITRSTLGDTGAGAGAGASSPTTASTLSSRKRSVTAPATRTAAAEDSVVPSRAVTRA